MIGFSVLITSAGSAPRRLRSSWASRCRVFFQRGAAGCGEDLGAAAEVVAADREGQEVEPGVDACDSRLLLVQGKTPFLQPDIQSGGDRLGLLATVAQRHEIVRIGDNGWVPVLDSAAVVVFDTRSCLHSLQRDIKQQR